MKIHVWLYMGLCLMPRLNCCKRCLLNMLTVEFLKGIGPEMIHYLTEGLTVVLNAGFILIMYSLLFL